MTNGQDKVEMPESTLSTMIEDLESSYPGFKERLIDENGELRYFVNIYLNGEDVRFLDGLGHRRQRRRRNQHSTGGGRGVGRSAASKPQGRGLTLPLPGKNRSVFFACKFTGLSS